ncbi:MAG: hypothetical protein ACKOX6_10695 [Bdellovibrio sp.]
MKKYGALTIIALGAIYFVSQRGHEQTQDLSSTSSAIVGKDVVTTRTTGAKTQGHVSSVVAENPQESLDKIQTLVNCYSHEKCKYRQTDPKSYQVALNKEAASFLQNTKASEFSESLQMQKSLRDLMKEGDGFVQEEVLKLMSQLPVSEENLQAIIEGLKNNYADPLIMEQVMGELARYNNSGMAEQVRGFMAETLLSGPQYSAETAAQKIRPLLNSGNIAYYRGVAEKSHSIAVKNALQSSLNDYELSLGGG